MLADDELTDMERRVVKAAATGEPVGFGSDSAAEAESWPAYRRVRAELLVELLTGRRGRAEHGPKGVTLVGVRITGRFDLGGAIVSCPVALLGCWFDKPIDFREMQAVSIRLNDSHLPGIAADYLRTSHTVNLAGLVCKGNASFIAAHVGGQFVLNQARLKPASGLALQAWGLTVDHDMWCYGGFEAEGGVQLAGARIGRSLALDGATLTNHDGYALDARDLTVEQSMSCADVTATGGVDLSSGHVRGMLDLRGASLTNAKGRALDAARLTVGQNMRCWDGFTAAGTVCLVGARIEGALVMSEAKLTAGPDVQVSGDPETEVSDGPEAKLPDQRGLALEADMLTVGQNVSFASTVCDGELRLTDAQIGGAIFFTGARLTNPGRDALVAVSATVGNDLMLGGGCVVTGEVRLHDTRVGGIVDLAGATLANDGARAFYADGLVVDGAVLGMGLTVTGEFRLTATHIGGHLDLSRADLSNPGGTALEAADLVVGGNAFVRNGFSAKGIVVLTGADVGGEFDLRRARLSNAGDYALAGRGLKVGGDMICGDAFTSDGCIRLRDARIGGRLDFGEAELTGAKDGVGLDAEGLRASALVLMPVRPPDGVVDLTDAHVGTFLDRPSSWPKVLRLRGFVYESVTTKGVPVKKRLKEWVSRHEGGYAPGPYDELAAAYRRAGYGERARRVSLEKQWCRRSKLNVFGKAWNWFLWATVGYGYRTWLAAVWLAAILVLGSLVFAVLHPAELHPAGAGTPAFNAFAYTVDVLLPVGDLGQQAAWQAEGAAVWWSFGLALAGWLLVTAVVAGLTNALSRDQH
ncbi:MAG: hypothetical protein GEV10_31410 [Streptosporangiales bacterium]|nr:hypothetical protein [Streptosporangiales bacterium]